MRVGDAVAQRPFFLRSVTGWKSWRNSHCGTVPEKDLEAIYAAELQESPVSPEVRQLAQGYSIYRQFLMEK
jgi:hypothetical protein